MIYIFTHDIFSSVIYSSLKREQTNKKETKKRVRRIMKAEEEEEEGVVCEIKKLRKVSHEMPSSDGRLLS